MSTPTPDERRAQARKAVLDFLVPRQSLTFDVELIQQRINSKNTLDFQLDADDVTTAIAFLLGVDPEPLIKMVQARFSSTKFYQATTAGVLAHERGDLE